MSGRAGRRGKDERGICIIMIDEQVMCHLLIFSEQLLLTLFCHYILFVF